jgi:hypothetical protein
MEGFWTVHFKGVQGLGAGVVMLIGGQLFGGDTGFFFRGTYSQQGNTMTAHVHVKQHVLGMANVMRRNEFDLELNGTMQGDTISVTGKIPGTSMHLAGTLKKQGSLPAKAATA